MWSKRVVKVGGNWSNKHAREYSLIGAQSGMACFGNFPLDHGCFDKRIRWTDGFSRRNAQPVSYGCHVVSGRSSDFDLLDPKATDFEFALALGALAMELVCVAVTNRLWVGHLFARLGAWVGRKRFRQRRDSDCLDKSGDWRG